MTSHPCTVHVCVINAGFDAYWSCALLMGHVVGSSLCVNFDLCHASSIGLLFQSTQVEWRGGYEKLLIVWMWICSTHAESGLWCGCGGMSLTSLCACTVLLALLVIMRWCCCVCVCSGPFLLAQPLSMHTSGSCHTPA